MAEHMKLQQRDSGLPDYQKLESVVLLMAAGGDCYDDMRVLQPDEGLERLIGYELPSPDAVRTYANALHDENLIEQAKAKRPRGTVAYIPSESELVAGLAEVNVALCRAVAAQGKATRATLDHDATIQESHKQQAQAHYKGGARLPAVVRVLGGAGSGDRRRVPRWQRASGHGQPAADTPRVQCVAGFDRAALLSRGQRVL